MENRKFKYVFEKDKNSPTNSPSIISVNDANGKKHKTPNFLYKFYSINENIISSLLSNRIFVSYPDVLNDIFDSLFINVNIDASEENKKICEYVSGLINRDFDSAKFFSDESYRLELKNIIYGFFTIMHGIISTIDIQDEDGENDLMWAHYANNDGVLVKFDYREFSDNFGKPFPISYIDKDDYIKSNNVLKEILLNFYKKKSQWSYEKEYRILVTPNNYSRFETDGRFSTKNSEIKTESRLQEYPIESIKKIILGFNFFINMYEEKNKIIEINFENSKNGLIKKALIDFAIENKIELNYMRIVKETMKFKACKLNILKKSIMIYEIIYS